MKGRIKIDKEMCKGCGLCILFCPRKLIKKSENLNAQGYYPAALDDPENKCNGCDMCGKMCPEPGTIEVIRIIEDEDPAGKDFPDEAQEVQE